MSLDNVSNFFNFKLPSVLFAGIAAKFQALFHVHNRAINAILISCCVCFFSFVFHS